MAVAEEIATPLPSSSGRMARIRERLGLYGLFGALAAFTLFTLDGGDLAPRMISAIFLVLAAAFLSVPFTQPLPVSLPAVCLLLMTLWGVVQTLLSPQKIVADGWSGVLFWFTAAIISFVATQLFSSLRAAAVFRRWFMFFAAGICLLELLEQASHTDLYYWTIHSTHRAVFGPFAYWNNFAQFVEIALPITLWTGLSKRHSSPVPYLVLAALEVAAVVSSRLSCGYCAGPCRALGGCHSRLPKTPRPPSPHRCRSRFRSELSHHIRRRLKRSHQETARARSTGCPPFH